MQSYWEDITPARASELLRTVAQNRRLSEPLAQQYARDMSAGRWHRSPQGISIDTDGLLRDGQHRLRAVQIAQITVPLWVTTDIPAEAFPILYLCRARTT